MCRKLFVLLLVSISISFFGCSAGFHTIKWYEDEADLQKAEQANGDSVGYGHHWSRGRGLQKEETRTRHCRVVPEKGFEVVYINDSKHTVVFDVSEIGSSSGFSLGPTLLKGTFMKAHLPKGDYLFTARTENNAAVGPIKHVGSASKFCGYTGGYTHQDFVYLGLGETNDHLMEVFSNDSLAE